MIPARLLAAIPSPPANGISLGPLRLHVYGLMIAAGVVAAVWLAQRRLSRIGGPGGVFSSVAVWAVPGGLIGARLYSIATSWQIDTGGHPIRILEIWRGGLGIWGGVIGGVLTGLVGLRRAGLRLAPALDCVAPALLLAQGIGRWGNYFNQELFGWPTSLPWGLEISPSQRPARYAADPTFQPTFLYESLWDIGGVFVLLWAERRLRIRRGYLFALYCADYTVGRFWTEYMRVDPAHRFFGLRLNDWSAIVVFLAGVALLALRRWRPGLERAGAPLAAPDVSAMAAAMARRPVRHRVPAVASAGSATLPAAGPGLPGSPPGKPGRDGPGGGGTSPR